MPETLGQTPSLNNKCTGFFSVHYTIHRTNVAWVRPVWPLSHDLPCTQEIGFPFRAFLMHKLAYLSNMCELKAVIVKCKVWANCVWYFRQKQFFSILICFLIFLFLLNIRFNNLFSKLQKEKDLKWARPYKTLHKHQYWEVSFILKHTMMSHSKYMGLYIFVHENFCAWISSTSLEFGDIQSKRHWIWPVDWCNNSF